ncbi:HAMP domain-containing sensor histidine kinase [Streptomyces fulvoviolaceus]|uniref:HAMP domain-containing sensor histidine kinase n=1 Tax=Streptomyces fulvoviolaceus TaxID=285535 RepID=UPI0021C20B80|nr:ATP-binding protein [Streptomyces fulvoviolaceus]MCT9077574.1 ATP-binding protein [Streptomyces fulvoviolaceus]
MSAAMRTAMSLRSRFALAFAAVGAVVAVTVGALSYHAASDRVLAEIDRTLRSTTTALARAEEKRQEQAVADAVTEGTDLFPGPDLPGPGDEEEAHPVVQAVARDGTPTLLGGPLEKLPVSEAARTLAASGAAGQSDTTETEVDGHTYRLLTTALGGKRGALQVAVQVDQTHYVLGGMARQIAAVSLAVMLAAAVAGRLLAGRITRRLARLTDVAEKVSTDGRVDHGVAELVGGRDEVGRLSASFSRMLGRIVAAREAQERLVHDAAHELRTPLTSLLANATVLHRVTELSPDSRDRLLDDVQDETRELGHLVDELVELALAGGREEAEEPVDLAGVARRAARRVYRRTGRLVHIDADDSVVRGRPQGLERAVGNLLENAAKFDTEGSEPIEVRIRRGAVTVLDRGPGIAAADTGRVFDRFYRADGARRLPGSGLGLAIVHDVAEAHDGEVSAGARSGGGAAVGFTVSPARLLGPA